MKKILFFVLAVSFLATFLTSCREKACAGVTTQIQKAKVAPSERPI